jgi:hypothetical protein
MIFEFPFNLDDTPKHSSVRYHFESFDKSIFEELDRLEEILGEIDEKLSQNFKEIENDPQLFVFLFNLIFYFNEKVNTNNLQKKLAQLLTNINSLLIPEFFKFEIDLFSMTNQDKIINSNMVNPVLDAKANELFRIEEELSNNEDFQELSKITKKFLALTMLYISKGLKYKRKDISNNKNKLRSGKSLLNEFEALFTTLYKMIKNGVFFAIVNTSADKFMVKHLINTLGRLLMSNLIENKLFSLNLLEIFAMMTRHKYFDTKTLMRNIIMSLESDNQKIRKFIVKLLKSFLKKKDEKQIKLIVELSQTIMSNLVNKKNFTPEGQFAKNCKFLYSELAENHPAFFYNNFMIFRNFYASDSYFFRNIANEIVFWIIDYLQQKKQRASYFHERNMGNKKEKEIVDKLEEIKLTFLDLILARLNDKTVYTRSNTIFIISRILKKQLLDDGYVYLVFELVLKKSVDLSYNVRRRCLILIQEFLIYIKDIIEIPKRSTILKLLEKEQKKKKKRNKKNKKNVFLDNQENDNRIEIGK